MKTSYRCYRCATTIPFTTFVRNSWTSPTVDKCPRCGAAHAILNGEVDVISPVMHPLPDPSGDYRYSPWQLWKTRPITKGWYDCRFHDIEPTVLRLWWDGIAFRPAPSDERTVVMRTFLSWRGMWQ